MAVAMVAIIDVSITASSLLLWVGMLGIADPALMIGALVARSVALTLFAARILLPLRHYAACIDAGEAIDDATLLATDTCLQRAGPRIEGASAGAWAMTMTIVLLGAAASNGLPKAELLVAGILAAVTVVSSPVVLFHPLRRALTPLMHHVGQTLLARGLDPARPPVSLARELASHNLITIMVLIGTGGAIGTLLRVDSLRSEALSAELRRVEIAARTADHSEVRVLTTAELPARLEPAPAPDMAFASLSSAYDPARGRVVAAASLGEGRWAVSEAEPDEQLGTIIAFLAAFFISSLLPSVYNSRILGRSVVDPLERLDATSREVIEVGQLAEVMRIVPMRNDEIGALARTFNEMLDSFDELAVAAQRVAGGDLRTQVLRPGNLPDAYRAMLLTLRTMVEGLHETSGGLSAAIVELAAVIEVQGEAAEAQATSAREVTATTASLAHSAAQISEAAGAVQTNAEQSVHMASDTAVQIAELQTQAHGISELLELIREIADRSDLLALNGALEAVRAGEAGRGFGLVAAEMRRLAERVNGAVGDIHARVAGIDASVAKTVDATQRSRQLAENTADAARDINLALSEHEHQSAQTLTLAEQVVETVSAFDRASEQTRATADGLQRHAQELEQIIQHFELS